MSANGNHATQVSTDDTIPPYYDRIKDIAREVLSEGPDGVGPDPSSVEDLAQDTLVAILKQGGEDLLSKFASPDLDVTLRFLTLYTYVDKFQNPERYLNIDDVRSPPTRDHPFERSAFASFFGEEVPPLGEEGSPSYVPEDPLVARETLTEIGLQRHDWLRERRIAVLDASEDSDLDYLTMGTKKIKPHKTDVPRRYFGGNSARGIALKDRRDHADRRAYEVKTRDSRKQHPDLLNKLTGKPHPISLSKGPGRLDWTRLPEREGEIDYVGLREFGLNHLDYGTLNDVIDFGARYKLSEKDTRQLIVAQGQGPVTLYDDILVTSFRIDVNPREMVGLEHDLMEAKSDQLTMLMLMVCGDEFKKVPYLQDTGAEIALRMKYGGLMSPTAPESSEEAKDLDRCTGGHNRAERAIIEYFAEAIGMSPNLRSYFENTYVDHPKFRGAVWNLTHPDRLNNLFELPQEKK